MRFPAFVGGAYQAQSITAATDTCVNLFPQSLETSGESAQAMILLPSPGLQAFVTLPQSPTRGMYETNDRVFAVSGGAFGEVHGNGTFTQLGTVAVDAFPATFASNGTAGDQLLIVSGGDGYILTLSTNVFAAITDANFPNGTAQNASFVDGYFAVSQTGTTTWQVSDLFDGATWSGLDVAQRSFATDNIVALAVVARQFVLFGSQTTEFWYDSGATFPFQPVQGAFMQQGCEARSSVVNLDDSLYWLSHNTNGARQVLRIGNGYSPERISTHAVEAAIQAYQVVTDATAYGYQEQGHRFYVLTFPAAGHTWVFDSVTNLWHERTWTDPVTGSPTAQRQWSHAHAFHQHLVGDHLTGQIYTQAVTLGTDAGVLIRRSRRWQHVNLEQDYVSYDQLQIDLETGISAPATQVDTFECSAVDVDVSTAWVAPRSCDVMVECWGAGGPGYTLGGGGGAAYAMGTVAVTQGQSYAIVVGAGQTTLFSDGPLSSFADVVVRAVGGHAADFSGGGIGGDAASCVGDVCYSGGNGAASYSPGIGGGGGGAAGLPGNGASGILGSGGYGAGLGGRGGDGGDDLGDALIGGAPGGGGGGCTTGLGYSASGRVSITWTTDDEPEVMLRWSDDGGRTWSNERWASAGRQGQYLKRVLWNRLGRCRDRVFEIAMTAPQPWRLQNAYLTLRKGTP